MLKDFQSSRESFERVINDYKGQKKSYERAEEGMKNLEYWRRRGK